MSFRPAALVLHGAAAGIMSWGYTSLMQAPGLEWVHVQKGGFFQFLTIQGIFVAWLTVISSLACDVLPSVTIFRNVKRFLLMMSLPLAIVISAIYWSLILFMPTLMIPVAPTTIEPSAGPAFLYRVPLPIDLALHAAPAVTLFLDFFFFEKRYSKKQTSFGAPVVTVLFSVWYVSCSEYFAALNGSFVYPFLNTDVGARAAIYVGVTLLGLVSFWILNGVHP